MCTSITVLPQRMAHGLNLNAMPMKLLAVNGKDIECFSKAIVDIEISQTLAAEELNFSRKLFSKIDLLQANHQIPINKADIKKSFGLFEYLFMPFGLQNSSSTFQRFMSNIFMDVSCIFLYIDDILVFSESEEKHCKDLKKVLLILKENNLQISVKNVNSTKTPSTFGVIM